jgi:hypothetical protein
MNDVTISDREMSSEMISDFAVEILELVQSSSVLRALIDDYPDFLPLLIQAAEFASKTSFDRGRFVEIVRRAVDISDMEVELLCIGDAAGRAAIAPAAMQAFKDLARILKRLCPSVVPIGNSSAAPN